MNARLYTPEDYPKMKAWWELHEGAVVPEIMLPEAGIIVSNETDDLAAAWLSFDNSRPLAFAGWFVTNPKLRFKQSVNALSYLMGALEHLAKESGYKVLMPMVEKRSFKNFLISQGYLVGCESAVILVKNI
jgi:hypothetical protein